MNKVKTTTIIIMMAGFSTYATTVNNCIPSLTMDSVNVPFTCPQLGAPILPIPGALYLFGANDNGPEIDHDFNDVVGTVQFGYNNLFTITLVGAYTAWFDFDTIGFTSNLDTKLSFAHGPVTATLPTPHSEVVLTVTGHDGTFYSGAASRSSDELPHFWVQMVQTPTETPEPTTLAMAGLGLIAVKFLRRKV